MTDIFLVISTARIVELIYGTIIMALILTGVYIWWNLLRQIAFDVIAIYAAAVTARRDDDRRRVELKTWQQRAMAGIEDKRAQLQIGSAAMWKAGVYDVLIDDEVQK